MWFTKRNFDNPDSYRDSLTKSEESVRSKEHGCHIELVEMWFTKRNFDRLSLTKSKESLSKG